MRPRPLLITLALLLSLNLWAQDKTLLINRANPQSMIYNPAFDYKCSFVRLPIISGLYIDLHHTGFAYNDIFTPIQNGVLIDYKRLLRKSADFNYLKAELDLNLWSLGLKIKKDVKKQLYINAGLRQRLLSIIGYPDDYIGFIQGNGPHAGKDAMEFAPYINIQDFNELYIGASFNKQQDLRVGIRLKLYQGVASAMLTRSFLQLYTNPVNYALHLSARLNAHLSFPVNVTFDTNAIPSSIALNIQNPVNDFLLNSNFGIGIDLGMVRQIRKDLKIFASITDLGAIHWKKNTLNYYGEGDFIYEGVHVSLKDIVNNLTGSAQSKTDSILQEISNAYQLFYNNRDFWTAPGITRLYFGVEKKISNDFRIYGLYNGQIFNNRIHPAFTGAFTLIGFDSHLWITLSASYMDRTLRNIGAAFTLQILGLQLYAATDNLLFVNPRTTRNIGLQAGMVFFWGCRPKYKKPKKKFFYRPPDACPAYEMSY